jgi:hypothetical protein
VTVIGTSVYMIVFRAVHIVSAVTWGGSVFLFVTGVQPTAAAIAPAGAPFMAELLGNAEDRRPDHRAGSDDGPRWALPVWHDSQVYGGIGDFRRHGVRTSITSARCRRSRPSRSVSSARGRASSGSSRSAVRRPDAGGPTPEQVAEMGALQDRLKVLAR